MSFYSKIVDQLNVAAVPKEDVDANTYKLFDRFKELGTKKRPKLSNWLFYKTSKMKIDEVKGSYQMTGVGIAKMLALTVAIAAGGSGSAAEGMRETAVVGRVSEIADGDRLEVVATNADGKAEVVDRLRFVRNLGHILDAPIGGVYLPEDAKKRDALLKAVKPEIIDEVPVFQTATAPQLWKRARAVILEKGTLKAKGFFAASRPFPSQKETTDYLLDTIYPEVFVHLGAKDDPFERCGVAEYRTRHKKRGETFELRFKCMSLSGGEESIILVYHGYPRTDGTMDAEFRAIYGNIIAKNR